MEVLITAVGFFLFPISYHSYIVKATSRLYMAVTKDDHLFLKTKNLDPNDCTDPKDVRNWRASKLRLDKLTPDQKKKY